MQFSGLTEGVAKQLTACGLLHKGARAHRRNPEASKLSKSLTPKTSQLTPGPKGSLGLASCIPARSEQVCYQDRKRDPPTLSFISASTCARVGVGRGVSLDWNFPFGVAPNRDKRRDFCILTSGSLWNRDHPQRGCNPETPPCLMK